MSKWNTPKEVAALDLCFGPPHVEEYLPAMSEIPEDFKTWGGRGESKKWINIVDDWFFSGIQKLVLKPKVGIDNKVALGHVRAIMASWEPSHEHKTAGVAWLMSLWFDSFDYQKVKK